MSSSGYVTARRFRLRVRAALRREITEARKDADKALADGNGDGARARDAYADGLARASQIVCLMSVSK